MCATTRVGTMMPRSTLQLLGILLLNVELASGFTLGVSHRPSICRTTSSLAIRADLVPSRRTIFTNLASTPVLDSTEEPVEQPEDSKPESEGNDVNTSTEDTPSTGGENSSTDVSEDKTSTSIEDSEADAAPKATVEDGKGEVVMDFKKSSDIMKAAPTTTVVVTGASGRVGQLTIRRILEMYPWVLVRAVGPSKAKVKKTISAEIVDYMDRIEVVGADLKEKAAVSKVVKGASAIVWCATGFAGNSDLIERFKFLVRMAFNAKNIEEIIGVRYAAEALHEETKTKPGEEEEEEDSKDSKEDSEVSEEGKVLNEGNKSPPLAPGAPRFVLLSSAAVTRPGWSTDDKYKYAEAAEVPIVKLNPSNILGIKAEGEEELRQSNLPYAVVRPCGLNDDHPPGRPIFSCGDLASGRISRYDVAAVLAQCLATPQATGKTFEVLTMAGLPKVPDADGGIQEALSRLPTDKALEEAPSKLREIKENTYSLLLQLRPLPPSQKPTPSKALPGPKK
ncbi:unnamed protein product [Choristocarpus tenellus]